MHRISPMLMCLFLSRSGVDILKNPQIKGAEKLGSLPVGVGAMPSTRCAHQMSSKKRAERVDSMITFLKTAVAAQKDKSPQDTPGNTMMTAKLVELWSVPQSSITEFRLLLTLGADPTPLFKDDFGEKTLKDRIENGSVCEECAVKFKSFLEYSGVIFEEMFERTPIQINRNKKVDGVMALCLDGGGMRGLVSVVCLLYASRRILGDESLPSLFDWCIGTSTGSMLGLSLVNNKSISECFFQYWDMKSQIFLRGSTVKRLLGDQVSVQTKNIDKVLSDCFPTETMQKCPIRLTIPALDISTTPARLHVFRNYSFSKSFGAPVNEEQEVLFREAARASSAAPTYFEPFVYGNKVLVDGSFVANYPLNILFKECDSFSKHQNPLNLAGVLSIGTGEPALVERKFKCGTSMKSRAKNIGHISTLILEQVVGQDLTAVEMAQDRCHAHNIPFNRLSPKGIAVRIDQIDDAKLMDMIWTTLIYLTENVHEIDQLGEMIYKLKSDPTERKRRSNTVL
uniref:PNPLA domain-containing protein n=1 Tax=Caenorhabditis japonica TaxID=281687 RepID=A0A8R1I024_CAEJA